MRKPQRNAALLLVAVAALLLLVTRLGSGSPSTHVQAAEVAPADGKIVGWLYEDAHYAMFLRWTEKDRFLTGAVRSIAFADPDYPAGRGYTFTGVRQGHSITLELSTGAESRSTVSGTIDGSELRLILPRGDGSLHEWAFRPGTTDDYNAALTAHGAG